MDLLRLAIRIQIEGVGTVRQFGGSPLEIDYQRIGQLGADTHFTGFLRDELPTHRQLHLNLDLLAIGRRHHTRSGETRRLPLLVAILIGLDETGTGRRIALWLGVGPCIWATGRVVGGSKGGGRLP